MMIYYDVGFLDIRHFAWKEIQVLSLQAILFRVIQFPAHITSESLGIKEMTKDPVDQFELSLNTLFSPTSHPCTLK